MTRRVLSDSKWERIKEFLPGKAGGCGVTAKDNRLFIEAVLWILRTGSPWRDLPGVFGCWHRVYVRYSRWGKKGTWAKLLSSVSDIPDLEYLMVDGNIVRGHQHGAAEKYLQEQEAMGKSRGGLSTKIHAAVDALGNPVRLLLTPGQASEFTQAEALVGGFRADFVIADKGYDSDAFVDLIQAGGGTPVIPPKSNRKTPRDYDKDIYKERNLVERVFQKLKHYRRVATRYERLAVNYMTMLNLASVLVWIN